MAVSGGNILLDLFQSQGIEYIFCSPGSEWVPVWEELARRHGQGEKTLKYINCRHETLAVSMAMGYTKTTGRLPAVLLHAGVGPLHAAMAIRTAYQTQIPMIICSAEDSDHGEDGEVKGPGEHWIGHLSDIGGPAALVRPYVKWSNTVKSKDTLLDSVYRGCQIARTAPPGPVFLAISRELLFKSLPETKTAQPPPVASLPQPRPRELEEVAQQLIESTQPIIITEHAGEKPEAAGKLIELAELLSIPVFECNQPSFANFPKNHPLHMGYDASEALKEADTVFVIGGTTPWYPPTSFPRNGAKVILLDEAPLHERLPYWGYQVDLSLTADIGQGLAALVDTIRTHINAQGHTGSHYQERLKRWRLKHEQMVEQWEKEALAGQGNKPISSKWFFYTLNKVLPSDSIILEETILHAPFLQRYLAEPNRYIRTTYGGLGIGLGEAAGVKLARRDRPVIFLVGDGTFNYNPVLAGLGLCQEYNLPILIIVLNNGGYITMKQGYHMYFPDGWAASHKAYLGVDITPGPDYTKVAEAFDAYGERLEEPGDIEPALNRVLQQIAQGRAALLDVILDTP